MDNSLIKSRKRVVDHGEVFTSDKEVDSMLDLVQNETYRIDSRFLEPACGDGNFLVKVLDRKMTAIDLKSKKNEIEYSLYLIVAVSSIYGVELLYDNLVECRRRIVERAERKFISVFNHINQDFIKVIKHIAERNILCGDALTLTKPNSEEPLIFPEWSFVGSKIKRRDYTLAELLRNAPDESGDMNLFSDMWNQIFIPKPIKDFPLIHFMKVVEYD
jgi:hypothetical protein